MSPAAPTSSTPTADGGEGNRRPSIVYPKDPFKLFSVHSFLSSACTGGVTLRKKMLPKTIARRTGLNPRPTDSLVRICPSTIKFKDQRCENSPSTSNLERLAGDLRTGRPPVTHSPGHRRPGVPARASRSLLADRPALDSARATVPRARGRLPAGRDQRAEAGD